jgi:hypothetical protein
MSAPRKKSDTRVTELIGMDTDGKMYLWDTGEVRPVATPPLLNLAFLTISHHGGRSWLLSQRMILTAISLGGLDNP